MKGGKKKAISSSIDQIYGAERFLQTVDEIIIKDRKTIVKLPTKEERSIYRIAIAFGRKENFPLETGDFGNGFVHVFDEESTSTVLNELDTFPDFINYLKAKEKLLAGRKIIIPKEVDFLALYIQTSLEFEINPDYVVIDNDLWFKYIKSNEYKEWQKEIQQSYIWDKLVTQLYKIHIEGKSGIANREELEIATRIINLESRINRIELGMLLHDALQNKKMKARMVRIPDGSYTYVLMPLSDKNWNGKESELQLRCAIARCYNPTATKVIGLAIGESPEGEFMFDIAYLNIPELNDEFIRRVEDAKNELGFFKNPVISNSKDMRN